MEGLHVIKQGPVVNSSELLAADHKFLRETDIAISATTPALKQPRLAAVAGTVEHQTSAHTALSIFNDSAGHATVVWNWW